MLRMNRTQARLAMLLDDANEGMDDAEMEGPQTVFGRVMLTVQFSLIFALEHPDEARELLKAMSEPQPVDVKDAAQEVANQLHDLWNPDEILEADAREFPDYAKWQMLRGLES